MLLAAPHLSLLLSLLSSAPLSHSLFPTMAPGKEVAEGDCGDEAYGRAVLFMGVTRSMALLASLPDLTSSRPPPGVPGEGSESGTSQVSLRSPFSMPLKSGEKTTRRRSHSHRRTFSGLTPHCSRSLMKYSWS